MNRKIIQLSAFEPKGSSRTEVWLLADDGTLWRNAFNPDGSPTWRLVDTSDVNPAIPRPPTP